MVGDGQNQGEPVETGLDELKHNLKVSFSRMKEDIRSSRQQIDDLIKLNKALQEQMAAVQAELKGIKEQRPKGLKTELMRGLARNQKALIKQRMVGLAGEGRYSIPELKDIIVDDKNYCSKASFYRYLDELKADGKLDIANIGDREIIVVGSGVSKSPVGEEHKENFV
jgi:hypothetical protein